MEDHMKTGSQENMECEFNSMGCGAQSIKEDQGSHATQNDQKCFTLTTSLALAAEEQLHHMLLELHHKKRKEEETLKKEIKDLENKVEEQELKISKLQGTIEDLGENLKKKTKRYESELCLLKSKLKDKAYKADKELNYLRRLSMNRRFTMENFSKEKAKDKHSNWKCSPMYTHQDGYKFCIGVDANGWGGGRGNSVRVDIWAIPGRFDDKLRWPVRAHFTICLINQQGGADAKCTSDKIKWNKPSSLVYIGTFSRISIGESYWAFIEHSELHAFLRNDALRFVVSEVNIF